MPALQGCALLRPCLPEERLAITQDTVCKGLSAIEMMFLLCPVSSPSAFHTRIVSDSGYRYRLAKTKLSSVRHSKMLAINMSILRAPDVTVTAKARVCSVSLSLRGLTMHTLMQVSCSAVLIMMGDHTVHVFCMYTSSVISQLLLAQVNELQQPACFSTSLYVRSECKLKQITVVKTNSI